MMPHLPLFHKNYLGLALGLGYLWWPKAVLPLLEAPNLPAVRHHGVHAGAWAAAQLALQLLLLPLGVSGWYVVWGTWKAVSAVWAVRTYRGEIFEIPLIETPARSARLYLFGVDRP